MTLLNKKKCDFQKSVFSSGRILSRSKNLKQIQKDSAAERKWKETIICVIFFSL